MIEPKVLVAIPTLDGYVHAKLVQRLIPQLGKHLFAMVIGDKPVAKARNGIVEQFLKTDATHLLMIDADTVVPDNAIQTLLDMDAAISSGITPMVQGDLMLYNIYKEVDGKLTAYTAGHPLPKDDRMDVKAVGASCLMVRRDVFEKMGNAPWFFDVWTQANQYISEDIQFCNIARELGYPILVSPNVMCQHIVNIVV